MIEIPHIMDEWTDFYKKNPELYLNEFESKSEEGVKIAEGIANYIHENKPSAKIILDIPCGTGRISIPLARQGFKVIGIDFSKVFIEHAISKAVNNNLVNNVNFLEKDMYDLKSDMLETRPDVIINWWTSIGYHSPMKDVTFFKRLRDLSKTGTLFMVETWHREFIINHPIRKMWKSLGNNIVLVENNFDYSSSSIQSNHKYYEKNINDLKYLGQFDSRIIVYDKDELELMLEKSGWKIVGTYNDIFTRAPFLQTKDRLLIISKAI